ncbi:Fic family protein [Chitinophagaceae bacterium 26-R-25]|nr:Fic family protein [Chitinophagaceae bacterium 26-R-25]
MNSTIERIEHLRKELQSLLPMKAEDQQRLDKKFRLEFNYNSNHIEGNTLTYGETALLLFYDDTKGNHTFREYEEMKSHDVAFDMVKDWAKDKERPLSETQIKNLNEIILVRPFWKDAVTPDGQNTRREIKVGEYKKYPNSVRLQNGEMFHYASPTDTPIKMGELIEWFRSEEEKGEMHPVQLAAVFHYKFVCIHPFDDGNGRISRLLMNYVLLKNDLPPVIIKSDDKRNYLQALHLADIGDLNAFVDYVAEQLGWSLEISIKAAKGDSVDEDGDLDKKLSLLKKQLRNKSEDDVVLKYSSETYKQTIDEIILPLLGYWETELQKFDSLILDRNMILTVEFLDRKRVASGVNNEGLQRILYDTDRGLPKKLLVNSTLKGLRNIDNSISVNGGELTVDFFGNSYEIKTNQQEKGLNRLYHQHLDDDEIKGIIQPLTNKLFNIVEETIANNKKI